MSDKIYGFSPVFNADSKVLILGSFPSVKSRQVSFYYGNRQNRFWKTLSEFFGEKIGESGAARRAFVLSHKIALWDAALSEDEQDIVDEAVSRLAAAKNALTVKDDAAEITELTKPADPAGSEGAQTPGTAGETGGSGEKQAGSKAGNIVPATGERSVWAVLVALCLVSGACAVLLLRRRNN